MFPHHNNIRERRVGQPPMAPQHLMGMPQQGPGVIMPMPTQQVQIMTQNHYPNQNSYSAQGQSNVSSYVGPQQVPPQKSNYHQTGYSHNNPQVILTKQAINRNKNYRKEYNIMKDPVNYNINNQNNQQSNFSNNESNSFSGFHQGNYNGHYSAHVQKENLPKSNGTSHDVSNALKENEEVANEENGKTSENKQEGSTMSQNVVTGAKQKTPMCLVNELARFNKITHQYRLTNEQGPAHKKNFTVTLTLGTEEYTADGPSIKKAQHSAAADALTKTAYSHPIPKANKNIHSGKSNITPTVELNALAMKRGEPAIYKLLEPTPAQHMYPPQSLPFRSYGIHRDFRKRRRSNFLSRGGRIAMKPAYAQNMHYTVSLKVGSWEFFGEGLCPQSARHDAASKALAQLKMLPVPEENLCSLQKDNSLNAAEDYGTIKSPISLVHEIALKRNMNVCFEVVSDRGPPHMKIFVTKCTVGELTATGEGNGKKVSKKRAAENMLTELKKLPPLSPSFALSSMRLSRMKRKYTQAKKKSRDLIKVVQDNKGESEYGEEINPISRLIQLQQLKKEKEPVYTLLEEKGTPKKREFLMEVSIGQLKATGSGPNKKLAKKAAAQNLLTQMGYGKQESGTKATMKLHENSQDSNKDRKVTFVDSEKSSENNAGGSAGRQLKPGIYVMSCDQHCTPSNNHTTAVNMQTTATIAKELLKGGNSPTADALVQNSTMTKTTTPQTGSHSFRPKDQLSYLAELLNFQVCFSDFPKGNHSEFLSLVTMSTDPSHVCHGSGPSIEESQDQAALTALRALSEMGLDSVTATNPTKELGVARREL